MSVCARGVTIARRTRWQLNIPAADLPMFLCPAWIGIVRRQHQRQQPYSTSAQTRPTASGASHFPHAIKDPNLASLLSRLIPQCTGCGALSQTIDEDAAGYYDLHRRSVEEYLKGKTPPRRSEEDAIIERSLQAAADVAPGVLNELGISIGPHRPDPETVVETPLCHRCHNIKHHHRGESIYHPSIQSIKDTLFESPHKLNHVYHVIDAADFPMSLIPGLHSLLDITPQRSLNRRSKTGKFYQGKKTEVSFIITRSDLLAPKKEQVDEMMPYLREVLRKELGRAGRSIRLGNVRCVSAKTGWWIKGLKEDIWRRGGGGWMVGKANVGKSQLFGVIFPKGRRGSGASRTPQPPIKSLTEPETKSTEMWSAGEHPALFVEDKSSEPVTDMSSGDYLEAQESPTGAEVQSAEDTQEPSTGESASIEGTTHSVDPVQLESLSTDEYLEAGSLLPPAQIETDYPEMPLVSMLPGTTASPIRVPFGNGRGELIDLPGLARTDLELYVRHEHRPFLVMATRVQPEQQVIKPGKSVLLGGFIRITPTTPDVTFLAYTFTPLKPHLTSTAKAIRIQTQAVEAKVENIALPGTGEKIASAGTFHLKWDVTRQRAGPLTSRDGAAIKVEKLPFRVMAADILIEGVGWVEIVAQIRKRPGSMPKEEEEKKKEEDNELQWEEKEEIDEIDPEWPAVEVFSPEGKFIAVRMPLNAWLKAAMKPSRKHLKIRPRKSMKGVKKAAKMRKRQMA